MPRERDANRKMFHRGHYEVIAARFREQVSRYVSDDGEIHGDEMEVMIKHNQVIALTGLAEALAERFTFDNEEFKPDIFYERCGVHFE